MAGRFFSGQGCQRRWSADTKAPAFKSLAATRTKALGTASEAGAGLAAAASAARSADSQPCAMTAARPAVTTAKAKIKRVRRLIVVPSASSAQRQTAADIGATDGDGDGIGYRPTENRITQGGLIHEFECLVEAEAKTCSHRGGDRAASAG